MYPSPDSSFDANLIVVPNDPMGDFADALVYSEGKDGLENVPIEIQNFMDNMGWINLQTTRGLAYLSDYKKVKDARRSVVDAPKDSLIEAIYNGRINITYLLNTFGGKFTGTMNAFNEHAKNNGGVVNAIGGRAVGSAGAVTFMSATFGRRFLVPSGVLGFHLSDCTYDRKEEIVMLKELLLHQAVGAGRAEIAAHLDSIPLDISQNHPEGYPIRIEAMRAHELHLAEVTNSPSLALEELSGIDVDFFPDAVRQYFSTINDLPKVA